MSSFGASAGLDVHCAAAAAFCSTSTSVACTQGKVCDRRGVTFTLAVEGIGTDESEGSVAHTRVVSHDGASSFGIKASPASIDPQLLVAAASALLPSQCCRPDT